MTLDFTEKRQKIKRFHQAKWDEPLIFEMSQEGERGILVPDVEETLKRGVGDVLASIPQDIRRKQPPKLPEISQSRVLRHYLRLSQETLGTDLNIDVGQGTCTMKYSPKINEQLVRIPQMNEIHPLQDEQTVQGILEVMYKFKQILKEIFHHKGIP
jgi:glycine dehydrogenase subunit 2